MADDRWRKVSEEMPEPWHNVLAWVPDLDVSVVVYIDDDGGWSNAWTEGEMELPLTHWRPLPAPPEED